MKNEMNGFVNRFLPAPYVVGGRPRAHQAEADRRRVHVRRVRRRDDDRAALGARARDVDLAVGVDRARRGCAAPPCPRVSERHRREQEAEQRRPDAGRELVDARIEVADDVLAVVADEARAARCCLSSSLIVSSRRDRSRQRSAAPFLLLLESLDLVVRDVVEHVLERGVAARLGLGDPTRDDAALDLREQAFAVGVEPFEAIFGFPDRPVARHRGSV